MPAASSCSSSTTVPTLNPKQAKLIESHPCFNKQAHQYARIHLAVAPACNIQCNYCNRKFDCSNETRPGVSSSLLSPAAAVQRFLKVKQRVPETRVVGIAGPGDPLANPQATLATLKAVDKVADDVHLCVSTNGLALMEQLPGLIKAGVKHLTITINCVDAAIGEKIYSWVYFAKRRLRGRAAAQVLIDQQLLGLEAAISAGMLVKVNTVLIPGINDQHISTLSKVLSSYGAFIHNVMPLISEAEHGTLFGLSGQRGPTEHELSIAREQAGSNIAQMTHCQQCRADAVGKLGEDISIDDISQAPSTCTSTNTTTVAVFSKTGEYIDQHFGHAKQVYLYELSESGVAALDSIDIDNYCQSQEQCAPESEDRLSGILLALKDVDQVLCSRIGLPPRQALEEAGIVCSTDYPLQRVDQVLQSLVSQHARKTDCA